MLSRLPQHSTALIRRIASDIPASYPYPYVYPDYSYSPYCDYGYGCGFGCYPSFGIGLNCGYGGFFGRNHFGRDFGFRGRGGIGLSRGSSVGSFRSPSIAIPWLRLQRQRPHRRPVPLFSLSRRSSFSRSSSLGSFRLQRVVPFLRADHPSTAAGRSMAVAGHPMAVVVVAGID